MYSGDHKKGEIEIISENRIISNKYATVYNDGVIFPGGNRGTYFRISSGSDQSVAILPVTADGKFIFVRNFRHGMRAWGIEIPKGGIEAGEDGLEAAKRELLEETGYTSDDYTFIGTLAESPAIMSGVTNFYIAENCKKSSDLNQEDTEAIDCVLELSLDEYRRRSSEEGFMDLETDWFIIKYIEMRR